MCNSLFCRSCLQKKIARAEYAQEHKRKLDLYCDIGTADALIEVADEPEYEFEGCIFHCVVCKEKNLFTLLPYESVCSRCFVPFLPSIFHDDSYCREHLGVHELPIDEDAQGWKFLLSPRTNTRFSVLSYWTSI